MCQEMSRYVKRCDMLRDVQKVSQDMSGYVKICQDMSRHFKICHPLSKSGSLPIGDDGILQYGSVRLRIPTYWRRRNPSDSLRAHTIIIIIISIIIITIFIIIITIIITIIISIIITFIIIIITIIIIIIFVGGTCDMFC